MKWCLYNGIIKYYKYSVIHEVFRKRKNKDGDLENYTDQREMLFFDEQSKDAFCQKLGQRNKTYTVTEHDQPSMELLQAVEGKKFNTIAEAREFIQAVQDGIVPKTDSERINDLELLVLQLGGVI
ncbi:MAG: hypothetical protein M0R40_10145 [Firmicutes bacterium]|nr:hypothetical protein [Bacillota bacterium]